MQPVFLKEGANEMEESLADIFRKLVRTGELLMDWREANVTPIPYPSFQQQQWFWSCDSPRSQGAVLALTAAMAAWRNGSRRACLRVIKMCLFRTVKCYAPAGFVCSPGKAVWGLSKFYHRGYLISRWMLNRAQILTGETAGGSWAHQQPPWNRCDTDPDRQTHARRSCMKWWAVKGDTEWAI